MGATENVDCKCAFPAGAPRGVIVAVERVDLKDRRVVDENVEPAERADARGHNPGQRVVIGDVAPCASDVRPKLGHELCRFGGAGEIREKYASPGSVERAHGRCADATRTAGNESDASFQRPSGALFRRPSGTHNVCRSERIQRVICGLT